MNATTEILYRLGVNPATIMRAGNRSLEHAWASCTEPRWLLWATKMVGVTKATYVSIACRSARTVLALAPDASASRAIEAAEAWLADPSEENRLRACDAGGDAYVATNAVVNSAARTAIKVAGVAALAAAYVTAPAAAAAATCAVVDAAYATNTANTSELCAIIREEIPWADVAARLGVQLQRKL